VLLREKVYPPGRAASLRSVHARFGRRVRWAAVSVLLGAWFLSLMLDLGGGLSNLLLVLGIVVLFYELLAAEPR